MSNRVKAFALIAIGLAIAAMGIYVAEADDAPGGAVMSFLLLCVAVWLGLRAGQNKLPIWAGRTALAIGVVIAGFAAFLTHAVTASGPLFAQSTGVPSASAPAPSPQVGAVDRARPLVRAAVMDQNLPGVSIAVGIGTDIVWAEGFGWRDVITKTPVTPSTRFNIGTAASVIAAAPIGSLGMTNTGSDSAADWSPEHVGEPEEDFPGFTAIHDLILRPLGISEPRKPLAGERARYYVPATFWKNDSTDPRTGRRLMFMRDLACCASGKPFYSTPSDLVRFALATKSDSVHGELAGGTVMSLVTRPDKAIAVAVASNISHANTAALAQKVADAFSSAR